MGDQRIPVYVSVLKYSENKEGECVWVAPTKDTPNCNHGLEIPFCDILGENKIDAALTLAELMTKTERFEFLLRLTRSVLPESDSNGVFDSILSRIDN